MIYIDKHEVLGYEQKQFCMPKTSFCLRQKNVWLEGLDISLVYQKF